MSRSLRSADRLIVALDLPTLSQALAMARRLRGVARTMKIGSALFTACGPEVIRRVRALGFEVMLDLKFFDIPSTVELSCRAATHHQVSLLTVHASGQPEMLRAAAVGVREEAKRLNVAPPLVLGVTVLTSVARGNARRIRAQVLTLAERARTAGCGGVVASAEEVLAIRTRFGRSFRIVCPGIRPVGATHGDQQRVMSPTQALQRGADYLVVGRPITGADHPRRAAQAILQEIKEADAC